MHEFEPVNNVEIALVRVQAGEIPTDQFLEILIASPLAVPSTNEVTSSGDGFEPLIYDKGDLKMVACFTSLDRAKNVSAYAQYCLQIPGGQFLKRIPRGYGVVVNPGLEAGFDISPQGIPRLVDSFAI